MDELVIALGAWSAMTALGLVATLGLLLAELGRSCGSPGASAPVSLEDRAQTALP